MELRTVLKVGTQIICPGCHSPFANIANDMSQEFINRLFQRVGPAKLLSKCCKLPVVIDGAFHTNAGWKPEVPEIIASRKLVFLNMKRKKLV